MSIARWAEMFGRTTIILFAIAAGMTILSLFLKIAGATEVVVFVTTGIALTGLAGLVGQGTDQIGARLGPGATGVLQSALGNLPELFISIFALQAGLVVVVQTALIGSILGNSLLVLGFAFFFGGLRHGTQQFNAPPVRAMAILLLLAVAALAIPTLATAPGAIDEGREVDLSIVVSVVLLIVFFASIPFSIRGGPGASQVEVSVENPWPMRVAIGVLAGAAVAAAFVSEWFVAALEPSIESLGISQTFAGLVIVAIAGNAVENVVGIQMAMRNRADLAISLILNSSLQVAVALLPALVLLSLFVSATAMTLVLSPLLLVAVALAVILAALVVFDGESTWLEGLALIGLYVIIAAAAWFGPAHI